MRKTETQAGRKMQIVHYIYCNISIKGGIINRIEHYT